MTLWQCIHDSIPHLSAIWTIGEYIEIVVGVWGFVTYNVLIDMVICIDAKVVQNARSHN